MSNRKSLDTGPQLAGGVSGYAVPTIALQDRGFNSIIRLVKRGRVAQVDQLSGEVVVAMKRLRLRSKKTPPVAGLPDGSDQVDVQTIISWLRKITRKDELAKKQLVLLASTIRARFA